MEYRALGKTGLRVSIAGFGTGGASRVGQRAGKSVAESVALVHAALERGVNLLDTSEAYGTEHIIGSALRAHRRDSVCVSTKATIRADGRLRTAKEITSALRASLGRLGTDYVDIYHLHAVSVDDYEYARDVLLPVLVRHRDGGSIRAVGITEEFGSDPAHRMLEMAVRDACWDVLMVGFNVINQSARTTVLEPARRAGIGTLGMFAVRRALSDPDELRRTLSVLAAEGYLPGFDADGDAGTGAGDAGGWLIGASGAASVTELAYRFCAHEPGLTSVLFGTGDRRHLEMNIDALSKPPLPDATVRRLQSVFAGVDHISGN